MIDLTPVSPEISILALTFVNTLNSSQVSNFFAWFLQYDVVELPESPAAWYAHIDTMEMRGWIALGLYLAGTLDYGMDIVVLDSICDRLRLQRRTVHSCLIQLSDPQKMVQTQLATAVMESKAIYKTEVQRLEYVQAKLHSLLLVAQRIKPTPASIHEVWRAEIEKRLRGYLTDVVAKRIEHQKMGMPLVGHSTCEQVSKDIQEGLRLNYLYEAMQQERQVPLVRYGLFSDSPKAPMTSSPSHGHIRVVPVVRESVVMTECQPERTFSIAKMRSENTYLRGENDQLRRDIEALVDANKKLVRKMAVLGRNPASLDRPNWNTTLAPTPDSPDRSQSLLLQVPRPRVRPRSLSEGAAQEYSAALEQSLNLGTSTITNRTPLSSHPLDVATLDVLARLKQKHQYSRPDSNKPPVPGQPLSTRYDVFAAFNEKPLPPLPSLDLSTRERLTSLDTSHPVFRPPSPAAGIGVQTPGTPTPVGGQTKKISLRTIPAPPVTPPLRAPVRKAMFMSDASYTAPSILTTNPTQTPSAEPKLASRSDPNARTEAPDRTAQPVTPLPAVHGLHNSPAELHAQSISRHAIQGLITPYAEPPLPMGMTKSRVQSIVRRLEGSVVDGEIGNLRGTRHDEGGVVVDMKRNYSVGRLDSLLRREGDDAEESSPDLSTEF